MTLGKITIDNIVKYVKNNCSQNHSKTYTKKNRKLNKEFHNIKIKFIEDFLAKGFVILK